MWSTSTEKRGQKSFATVPFMRKNGDKNYIKDANGLSFDLYSFFAKKMLRTDDYLRDK
jgi:hypothetical protein